MDDPGYSSYQDPRLIPPSISDPDPTPEDIYHDCSHASACKRIYCMRTCVVYPEDTSDEMMALILECERCNEWAE